MLALSPPFFPSFGWPLEDPISQEHNNRDISLQTSDHSLLPFPQSSRPQAGGDHINGTVKKLNHNASERDRRKKINNLYSSLFSLLPAAADRMKKLSIPTTVSCVVKYIPELQKEVERLVQKKEELSSRISRQQEDVILHHLEKRRKIATGRSLSAITVSPVGAKEIVIHISSLKANKSLLSETLHNLEEEDGLVLLNASSFESLGEKVVHNLHFQAQGNYKVDLEIIRRKLLSLYEKSEEMPF